jgi:hypothetical protein
MPEDVPASSGTAIGVDQTVEIDERRVHVILDLSRPVPRRGGQTTQ